MKKTWCCTPLVDLRRSARAKESRADMGREMRQSQIPGQFDVVVSLCVLTQLIGQALSVAKDGDGITQALAVRDEHLLALAELTRRGGKAILITDFVASDSCPEITTTNSLTRLADEILLSGNFFIGTHPEDLVRVVQESHSLSSLISGVEVIRPWIWSFSQARSYLTYALVLERGRPNQLSRDTSPGRERRLRTR